ncbi:unnamed protein product [Protopolystoma xenopodis]|uniref:Centrosomal protein of 44 kDa n=1 Tax=Protopolystoma xenopodis TaxID=117903 RepID=A0A3S5C3R5_9PLAT|nr:unnamed protein product [Protopolystoma xenopodis]
METVYRAFRDQLNLRPSITLAQFFSHSYAERKIELACMAAARVHDQSTRFVKRPTAMSNNTSPAMAPLASANMNGSLQRQRPSSQCLSGTVSGRSSGLQNA